MANVSASGQKTYHTKATGAASATVKRRTKDHDLKLFGSCFWYLTPLLPLSLLSVLIPFLSPFVQRVWISLEIKGLDYQYIEIDPYHKTDWFLSLNPRGLVPALRHGEWTCYESSVLMEYLEDLGTGHALLPSNPQARAHCRLWSDHVNRHVIPGFYRYLQAQDTAEQSKHAQSFSDEIKKLIDVADPAGPFFLGSQISFVDVQIAPWVLRMKRVLAPYRGWPEPEQGSRWARWVEAIEGDERVKATTSGDELYRDSYERYAQNRPDTSQVQKAINEGGGLP